MRTAGGPPGVLGLAGDNVALPGGRIGPATVWIDRGTGRITAVEDGPPTSTTHGAHEGRQLVHLGSRLLAPGFVDVHVHGAAGVQVNGGSATEVAEAVARVASFHAAHGTTALLATTVADTPDRLAATVAGIAEACRSPAPGAARVAGSHLEGPFIAPRRAGAQEPSQIRPPDRGELNRLLELGGGTVRLVTLAPELPGADALIADCLAAGSAVALGHTEAGYAAAHRAFDAGASHVTHLWNAMAPLHHRDPGLVGAALERTGVTVEVVCDLHHVHPSVVALTAKAAPGRTALVTDATSATGAGPGRFRLGSMDVEVEGTRAAVHGDPSTLAGSVLTMEVAVGNASGPAGLGLVAALAAASAVPANLLGGDADRRDGRPEGMGALVVGGAADLVVLEPTLGVAATLVGGAPAHDPHSLFS